MVIIQHIEFWLYAQAGMNLLFAYMYFRMAREIAALRQAFLEREQK